MKNSILQVSSVTLADILNRIEARFPAVPKNPAESCRIYAAYPGLRDYFSRLSPYAYDLFRQNDEFLYDCLNRELSDLLEEILESVRRYPQDASLSDIMRFLRLVKKKGAALILAGDLAEALGVSEVTRALSRLADACTTLAFKAACYQIIKKGKLPFTFDDLEQDRTGLLVLAMGKHGARELNFSSDIDLCVFYDSETAPDCEREKLSDGWIKVTQIAVKILSERTADGYVYRTDLRLRPDPGSMKIAVSLLAAERYYERAGQNWERAAFIKARMIYGDPRAEIRFRDFLRPFIWRRSLDYSAVRDIHSIKRQIHNRYGHSDIKLAGHDIKLGRGGIREIELFVQTQQLIGGGKDTRLRAARTTDALAALAEVGRIEVKTRDDLIEAYEFHRKIEHRLQMINDEQTHIIPADTEKLKNFAEFCFFKNVKAFSDTTLAYLERVKSHYDSLFADHPALGAAQGGLIFTGPENHPETVKNLAATGFKRPEDVCSLVRSWHTGAYKAMRTAKARELLTEFTPFLLEKLAETSDPDAAFMRFDKFLSGLPYGVTIFSLFISRPFIFDLIIDIAGASPEIADYMARNPALLEALLSPDFFKPCGGRAAFEAETAHLPRHPDRPEVFMNAVRKFTRERRFQIATLLLKDIITPAQAGKSFTDLARATVAAVTRDAEEEMRGKYGFPPLSEAESGICVIGAGSLGAGEMTAESDLDIVFVYDEEPFFANSERDPQDYYTKLASRILTGLTTRTSEGGLYTADTRLRPSGRSGPLAVRLDGFEDYYRCHAWTWELAALTRAEPLTGGEKLNIAVRRALKDALTARRDPAKIAEDLRVMRQKLFAERKPVSVWDVKLQTGGLFDTGFIMQYLTLVNAADRPEIPHPSSEQTLKNLLKAGIIEADEFSALSGAHGLLSSLNQVFSLLMADIRVLESAADKVKRKILQTVDAKNFMSAELSVRAVYETVRRLYAKYLTVDED